LFFVLSFFLLFFLFYLSLVTPSVCHPADLFLCISPLFKNNATQQIQAILPPPARVVIEPDSVIAAALQRLSAAKNATKQAVVGRVAAPLVAGLLDDAEDVKEAVVSAQTAPDKKLAAAGLPTKAALSARWKNATVVPAKAKTKAAINTLRKATDAAAGSAWDAAAKKEAAAFAYKRNASATAAANVSPTALDTSPPPQQQPPDKAAALIAAARNASASAVATKRAIEDAALDSEKGKARFSVFVTLDLLYDPRGGNSFAGEQLSSSSRPGLVPLLSRLAKAKEGAVERFKASVNATVAGASIHKAAALAAGSGGGGSSASSSSASAPPSVPAAAALPSPQPPPLGVITPVTVTIPSADGGPATDLVSFSSEAVLGLDGDTFFSSTAVNPFDVANVVRGLLVSKLRMLAAEGSAEASALLSLGDSSLTEGQRTAAPLLSARGVALDAGGGVYLVSFSFPALLPGAPLPLPATALRSQLINAVNDVDPSDPCASLAERTGYDVCEQLDDVTHMNISRVTLLAVESAPGDAGGTSGAFFPVARRSKASDAVATAAVRATAAARAAAAAGSVSAAAADRVGASEPLAPTVASASSYIPTALGGATAAAAEEVGLATSGLAFFAKAAPVLGFLSASLTIVPAVIELFGGTESSATQTLR